MTLDAEALAVVNAEVVAFLDELRLALDAMDLAALVEREAGIAETVARITVADLGRNIVKAIDKAVETGLIPDEWDRDDRPQEIVTTGLRNYDPRLAFQAGLRAAYGAGRYTRAKQSGKPYLIYRSRRDSRVRASHQVLNGVVLPLDDAWWDIHMPPNDPRCRCLAFALDDRGIDDLEAAGVELQRTPPEERMIRYTNPRTGATKMLPESVADGWDIHPAKQPERLAEVLADRYERLIAGI